VVLFRGSGDAARRYVEADHSRADDYYLGGGAVADWVELAAGGAATAARSLNPDQYEAWGNWTDPASGQSMGRPRLPGEARRGSPVFAEMVVNAPKSLSIAAALHPEVSEALDLAQRDAAAEIRRWLGPHSVTRVGPRGAQEVVPAEGLQTVGITHRTSREGDPHRHIHLQIGTRVYAAGAWRGLDTAALFKQQGAIRALGAAVIAAHPGLAAALGRWGLMLDPVSGEVAELRQFNGVMSKRSAQVKRNLAAMRAEWEQAHPGETPGPALTARMQAAAWAQQRPGKKPDRLRGEEWWRAELRQAGYDPAALRRPPRRPPVALVDLSVQEVASRALDRCAAAASTWTRHTVQEHVTRITTEAGVQAAPEELRDFITITTRLSVEDCVSVLPPGSAAPEHVAHLTSLRVIAADMNLRDLLQGGVPGRQPSHPNVADLAAARGLDEDQAATAAAIASTDPLVIVEGAAGAGKTTMLGAAIETAARQGRPARVVTATLRAAQAAEQELGAPAASAAALVFAHGWRWNRDGVWTRLAPGGLDPATGAVYTGPPEAARLAPGERIIVDEAGMLDQDTAIALLTVAAEAGATVALVGDRAQLPAVGRGGVLDIAAQIRGRVFDMASVHRFNDPGYAQLTLAMRDGADPGGVFDRLVDLGLVRLHPDEDALLDQIAAGHAPGSAVTTATNDEAAALNERIRAERVRHGQVDDTRTAAGSDGLPIGVGDVIQTRMNDSRLGVANRQTWTVQHIADDGAIHVQETSGGRKRSRAVVLPADYVAAHAHLAYAATAYGVQGATVNQSHTVLSDPLGAAGVYVGMTRGRQTNLLHVIAADMADAKAQFVQAMGCDRADRGLAAAAQTSQEAVAGLVADGPAKQVADELARLDHEAAQAERRAERWEQTASRLDAQRAAHHAERDQAAAALQGAEERSAQVRAEVAGPAAAQAETEGAAYRAAAEQAAQSATERARRLRHQFEPAGLQARPRGTEPALGR
jgi:hypothetical protein